VIYGPCKFGAVTLQEEMEEEEGGGGGGNLCNFKLIVLAV